MITVEARTVERTEAERLASVAALLAIFQEIDRTNPRADLVDTPGKHGQTARETTREQKPHEKAA